MTNPATYKAQTHSHVTEELKEKRARLVTMLRKERDCDFLGENAAAIDDFFRESFVSSMVGPHMEISRQPYAVIALGGYGRGEQCLHSDIDILFLFHKDVPPVAEDLIREMVYPLWDLGMEVGHATRSIRDCLDLASRDLEVLTALLDARFICGMSPLFLQLMERLHLKVVRSGQKRVMQQLIENNLKRHDEFGDSSSLLEPNLKLGQGGLRDYHTMLWLARIKFDLKQMRDFEYFGYLSHDEFSDLSQALSFIWMVRNRLHLQVGRKCDHLYFEHQLKIAESMNLKLMPGQAPVEALMGELHRHMDRVKQLHEMFINEIGQHRKLGLKRRFSRETKISGLVVQREMLGFSSSEEVVRSPGLLIRIFHESGRLRLPLGSEARRVVREFGHLIDQNTLADPDLRRCFEGIMAMHRTRFNPMDEMLNTGVITCLIPEFRALRHRIQYNQYHIYPVDKHSIRTLQAVAAFGQAGADPLYADIYKGLKQKPILLWSALLHDIGKAVATATHPEEGAGISRKILGRMGYKPPVVDTVAGLIADHLFLVQVATRRDIHAEETAVSCAGRIGDPERLKMLYLLTVADSMSTGPKAWNDWTASLLRDLFFKILNILETGELATQKAQETIEDRKATLLSMCENSRECVMAEAESLIEGMSTRYMLDMPASKIIHHMRLYASEPDAMVWMRVETPKGSNVRVVSILGQDRPGLLSSAAGVMTMNHIDILDAQVYPWAKGLGLSVYTVTPPPDQLFEAERWDRVKKDLQDVLNGAKELSLAELVKKKRGYGGKPSVASREGYGVRINNKWSGFFTIVEVIADDTPGLLFAITDVLHRCRLDICVAKIATKVDQVIDVFYVRDFAGDKILDSGRLQEIQSSLYGVLSRLFPDAVAAPAVVDGMEYGNEV